MNTTLILTILGLVILGLLIALYQRNAARPMTAIGVLGFLLGLALLATGFAIGATNAVAYLLPALFIVACPIYARRTRS